MESEFFLNAGVPPHPLHFVPTSTIPTWPTLSSAIEMQTNELNSSSDQTPNSFFNPNWEKSTDQSLHFDSALSSMVSSPAASNSNISSDNFMIRELIGKLGNIGNGNNSGEISQHSQPTLAASYNINNGGNNSTNTSCYSTPLNSPPKLNRFPKESLNFPNLGALSSSVAEFTADPGFAERAARFSCFGSRSFNGRTSQLGLNNAEFAFKCNNNPNSLMGNGKLPRVSSSPSLKAIGSQKGNKNSSSPLFDRSELGNSSQEENCSSVSEQTPNAEAATLKVPIELNSKKRKSVSKGKLKESQPANASKDAEIDETSNSKRSKSNEGNGNEKSSVKAEEEQKDEKQNKNNNISKPPEPPKDYIHVRARRGQATDSHSLAERVRREKISERMKLLQDLVPGCNKVTGKALMLDEIINYVQSLQRQVEFLSMKLASVNTRLDFNMDTLIPKDIFQSSNPIFPSDSSATAIFGHQPQQNPPLHSNISNGTVPQCSAVDPLDTALCQNFNMHLPPLDPFNHTIPQYPTFCEDDLQTIVQMGFGQNPGPNQEIPLQPQNFSGSSQASPMKIEP